jgi:hypothetical protein
MRRDFNLVGETLGYWSAPDPTNTDDRYLISGSQNVLIDYQKKVKIRPGYSRLGAANAALTPILKGWTWNTSSGTELPQRNYNGLLEVYLGTVDGVDIDAWTKVSGIFSTTKKLRAGIRNEGGWWDATELMDLQLMVNGDVNIYEWNGAIAVVDSVPSANSVKKSGTTTFGQNRFYTTRNKTFVCVRTGTEYTYTGGESTTTLTGIVDTTGLQVGDILIQKIVTRPNAPSASRINDTILIYQNQLCLGSFSDNVVYISKNTSFYDFTYSSPRVSGEGGLLTLDGPSSGLGILSGALISFAGPTSIFKSTYQQITVGSTLAETISTVKIKNASGQGSISPDCVVPIGDQLAYLSNEPALRFLTQPLLSANPTTDTVSNPIKPDFDAEDWTGAEGFWAKNEFFITAPVTSHTYIYEFTEDADGKKRKYWQPPQVMPVQSYVTIGGILYGHSNSVPETYRVFDITQGYSDINSSDEKLPINARARFAYRNYKRRQALKNFDEFYVEGEITPQTNDLILTLNYGWEGDTQAIDKTINGTDQDILQELVSSVSLGQDSLATEPIAGNVNAPADAQRFSVDFEIAREDFDQLGVEFSSNNTDRYWSIIASGPNVIISTRKSIGIKK